MAAATPPTDFALRVGLTRNEGAYLDDAGKETEDASQARRFRSPEEARAFLRNTRVYRDSAYAEEDEGYGWIVAEPYARIVRMRRKT